MPKIDKHAPGSFCWIELGTTDQAGAKNFYSSLFSWTPEDFPMGPDAYYTMFKLHGGDAGAAYTMRAEEAAQAPPRWNLYISVEDADRIAERATELSGKVLMAPMDVAAFGRMAVIQDPTGAVFCIWQPKSHIGTSVGGEENTLCWADLMTGDPGAAKQFYSGLFGWKISPGEKDPSGYLHIQNGDAHIGGIPPSRPGIPPHWLVYFLVADVDASAAKAKSMGAREYRAPMTMEGVGRWAVLADPQGAVFSIFKPSR